MPNINANASRGTATEIHKMTFFLRIIH
jgi:hypothetical protein